MNPVNGVLTTEMKNTDIPIKTKYPVLLRLTISKWDKVIQNIFPKSPPIESRGMNIPPGKPVAFEIIVRIDSISMTDMFSKSLNLSFSMISTVKI